jgi:NADH-quinone oxidoreductase subunit N
MEIFPALVGWYPEAVLMVVGLAVAGGQRWYRGPWRLELSVGVAWAAAVAATFVALLDWDRAVSGVLADGLFVLDAQAAFFKVLLVGGASWVILLASGDESKGEGAGLLLMSTAACALASAAADLLAAIGSLLLAAAALGMAPGGGLRRGSSLERWGAVLPGGLLLLGGLVVNGVTFFGPVGGGAEAAGYQWVSKAGWGLALAGIGGFLGVPPFHAFVLNTSHGSWSQTAFACIILRGAALAVLSRWLYPTLADGRTDIVWMMAVVAALAGHLMALGTDDLRRLLVWLGIGHTGFILCGLLTPGRLGFEAFLVQGALYGIGALGAYAAAAALVGDKGQRIKITQLEGVGWSSPFWAVTLLLPLICLAGLPPTAGFGGRFLLWEAAAAAGAWWVVWAGLACGLLAVAVCYRLFVVVYMKTSGGTAAVELTPQRIAVAWCASLGAVACGWWAGPLLNAVNAAFI